MAAFPHNTRTGTLNSLKILHGSHWQSWGLSLQLLQEFNPGIQSGFRGLHQNSKWFLSLPQNGAPRSLYPFFFLHLIFWEGDPEERMSFSSLSQKPLLHNFWDNDPQFAFFLLIRTQLSVLCPKSVSCSALSPPNLGLFCSLKEWEIGMVGKTWKNKGGKLSLGHCCE